MKITIHTSKKTLYKYLFSGSFTILLTSGFVLWTSPKVELSLFLILLPSLFSIGLIIISLRDLKKPPILFSFDENYIYIHRKYHPDPIPWEAIKDVFEHDMGKTNGIGFDLKMSYLNDYPKLLKKSKFSDKAYNPHFFVQTNDPKMNKISAILKNIAKHELETRKRKIIQHFKNIPSDYIKIESQD